MEPFLLEKNNEKTINCYGMWLNFCFGLFDDR